MRDDDWDINAFPSLFPTGKYGLKYDREKPLTPQNYFQLRLMSCDKRFAQSTPYVFASTYYVERNALESKINISYQKGRVTGGKVENPEDAFSVFEKLPGTPKYWQQKRYELLAKLEQLGPFQFFFTLSCADKRWDENWTSIFGQEGAKVTIEDDGDVGHNVFINDVPLDDYLEDINQHEKVRENVMTITRNFDQRVKAFVREIMMGHNQPLNVSVYNYRVEFQLRGAPHVHGVLWIQMPEMEKQFPEISEALSNLYLDAELTEGQKQAIINFVDTFTVCSLTDESVSEIVQAVQIHNHSKSCRKKNPNTCRFGYPKFPSDRTIIAQKLKSSDFESEEDCQKKMEEHVETLKKVKTLLESISEDRANLVDWNIASVLKECGVDEDKYYEALSVSKYGTTVILKRSVQEISVNNYNPEMLRAWNGNMDIQFTPDHYAIVTYITDYYSKDETGTMPYLQEAAKEKAGCHRVDIMRHLVYKFLTHREMGEFEGIYRIVPSLHLSESNVGHVFVATGFPDQRHVFLVKVDDKTEDALTIEGKVGKYKPSTSIHDKYMSRPQTLENICLAQFAIMYDRVSKTSKSENSDVSDTFFIASFDEGNRDPLPLAIKLSGRVEGKMKLRSCARIIRYHKFRQDTEHHQFMYSEMLLYVPWRQEEFILYDSFEACE